MPLLGADPITQATTVISHTQRLVNDSALFEVSAFVQDVRRNDGFCVAFITPPEVPVISQSIIAGTSNSEVVVTYSEGAIIENGLIAVAVNHNRENPKPAQSIPVAVPVVIDPGLPLRQLLVPPESERESRCPWRLAPSTTYLVDVLNIGNRRTDIEIAFVFLEVPYTV